MFATSSGPLQKWRLWIKPISIAAYMVALVILVPVMIVNAYKKGFNRSDQIILIAGFFVMMTLPISLWQIIQHMVHFNKPALQKHIIRVLWMVPIYSMDAWLGLLFPDRGIYVESLKECYEAFVIFSFMMYLLNYLNSESNLVASLEQKPQVRHFCPCCCLPVWKMGRQLVCICKYGVLQYTVVRPLTTAISFTCELNEVYKKGEYRADVAFPYITAINNLSQFTAMYCLVLFYRANKSELQPIRPLGKFLCIKAVIFFPFFQGVIISILVYAGVITSSLDANNRDTVEVIASKLQSFLICIEMFFAAIAHHYSFTYKAFIPKEDVADAEKTLGCWGAFAAYFRKIQCTSFFSIFQI